MSYIDTPWIVTKLSFRFPTYYFYLHDNCSYCTQFKLPVPFLSAGVS